MFESLKNLFIPNPAATTDRAVAYLNTLPLRTRNDIADKMVRILQAYIEESRGNDADFFQAMSAAKRDCRRRRNLLNADHLEFAYLKLLEDSVFSSTAKGRISNPGYSWKVTKNWIRDNANKYLGFDVLTVTTTLWLRD